MSVTTTSLDFGNENDLVFKPAKYKSNFVYADMQKAKQSSRPVYIGLNCYISPTCVVSLCAFSGSTLPKSQMQIQNELNLLDNNTEGHVSVKAMKGIRKAVNWLCESAIEKKVYQKEKETWFNYKVGFLTLTIPEQSGKINGVEFSKNLLNPYLTWLRQYHGLVNYVWKLELTKKGAIHCHLSIDQFIHWKVLRSGWNRLLKSNGYMEAYTSKYEGCTFRQYCSLRNISIKKNIVAARKAWRAGTAAKWTDPNSTDIHSVWKVKNLSAYIAKYMSKEGELSKLFRGRIWGCSQMISKASDCRVLVHAQTEMVNLEPFICSSVKFQPIMGKPNSLGICKRIGEIFLPMRSTWYKESQSIILQKYRETILFLQSSYTDLSPEFIM